MTSDRSESARAPAWDYAQALAALERLVPPAATELCASDAALGRVASGDTRAEAPYPATPIAAEAGYACAALDTLGASTFAPAVISRPLTGVAAGDALPLGCDAVLPAPLYRAEGPFALALGEVAPSDGVWVAGAWAEKGAAIVPAGRKIGPLDLTALRALGQTQVSTRRMALRLIVCEGASDAATILGDALAHLGADVLEEHLPAADLVERLPQPLTKPEASHVALTLILGGAGEEGAAAAALTRHGHILSRGAGLAQAPDVTLGEVQGRAVLVLPALLEAALPAALALVWPVVAKALGLRAPARQTLPLAAKIASPVGLAEVVPLRAEGGRWQPLWPTRLAYQDADGFAIMAAGDEGLAAGESLSAELFAGPLFSRWWG